MINLAKNGEQTAVHKSHPPLALGKILSDLPANGLVDVLAQSGIPSDPTRRGKKIIAEKHTKNSLLTSHSFSRCLSFFNVCAAFDLGYASHQGCLRACSQVNLLAGSFSIRQLMKSLANKSEKKKMLTLKQRERNTSHRK